jgi:hypothetical protein
MRLMAAAWYAHLLGRAFHDDRRRHQLVRVEALDRKEDRLLHPAHQLLAARRPRLQRLAEAELHVVHQPDAGRQHARLRQVVEKGRARLEVAEDVGAVALHVGQLVDANDGTGDNAQIALAAEGDLLRLDAHRHAGHSHTVLNDAAGCHQGDVLDDVLDVAVAVLLHAAGVGGDPAAKGGQFDAVRLMAAGEPLNRQPLFQMRTEDARLDAGAEVLPVNPFNGVHAAHVHRDDGARLIRRQLQGATDARPAAVGDEADVVGLGQLDQLLDVGLRLWVDDEIDDALQVGVEHLVDLVGRGLAVAVQQALAAVVGELVGREGGGQHGVEGGVALWLRHGLVGAFRLDVAQVNGHAQHLPRRRG